MSTRPIDVAEARRIINDRRLPRSGDEGIAAAILMEHCEHDLQITFEDMLRCLDYGGVIAEMGARCLYIRTGRDGVGSSPAWLKGVPFIVHRSDWETYLREHHS